MRRFALRTSVAAHVRSLHGSAAKPGRAFQAVRVTEFGDAGVLTVGSAEWPSLQAGQVLVRMEYAGVNPVDTCR